MRITRLVAFLIAPLLLTACASTTTVRVELPPKVDLRAYPSVGLVTFDCNGNSDLQRIATQKFLHAVQEAQPGTRVVELGSESQVLASVHRKSWDPATLRAVQQTNGVDVVVIGRLDLERAKPEFHVSTLMKSLSARSDVNAALSARLIETASGATMWTDSAKCTTNVANASFNGHGKGGFSVRDSEEAYGEMVDGLVWRITDDFRPHYVLRRVPRDQVQTASAAD